MTTVQVLATRPAVTVSATGGTVTVGPNPTAVQVNLPGSQGPAGAAGTAGPPGVNASALKWRIATDYGALGDGSHDDTSGIQAAIDAAHAAGAGLVYLPDGTYKISAALTVYNDIHLLGAGTRWPGAYSDRGGTQIVVATGSNIDAIKSDTVVSGDYLHHTILAGFTVTAASGQTSGSGIYLAHSGEGTLVRDVRVSNFPQAGIRLNGAVPLRLDNLVVYGNLYGIWIANCGSAVSIDGLSGDDNGSMVYVDNPSPTGSSYHGFSLTIVGIKAECSGSATIAKHNPLILCKNLSRGAITLIGGFISDWSTAGANGTGDANKAVFKLTSSAAPETSDTHATGVVTMLGTKLENYPVVVRDNILNQTVSHLNGMLSGENDVSPYNLWSAWGLFSYGATTDRVAGATSPAPLGARSTADLTLTTTAQDVPSCSLTLADAGKWLVTGVFDFNIDAAGDAFKNMIGTLVVGGVTQAAQCLLTGDVGLRLTSSQTWLLSGIAGGTVVKLQAKKSAGTAASAAFSPQTAISAIWVGN